MWMTWLNVLCFNCGGMYQVPCGIKYPTRYCPKCKKDETKGECKYGPKYWEMYKQLKNEIKNGN